MAYWGRDDEPIYYVDGRPFNDSARREEGPQSWADAEVKEDYEIMQELRRQHRNLIKDRSDKWREEE